MSIKNKIYLFIIAAALLLSYPTNALEDSFQYYPNPNDISNAWIVYADPGGLGSASASIVTSGGTYSRALQLAVASSNCGGSGASTAVISKTGSTTSNYWAFNLRSNSGSSALPWYFSISLYDSTFTSIWSGTLFTSQFGDSAKNGLWELSITGGVVSARLNGVNQGVVGGAITGNAYNIEFDTYQSGAGCGGNGHTIIIDDITTSGYISGIGTESTSHTLTESNLNPTSISFTLNTFPFADYTSSYFSNKIQKYIGSSAQTITSTTIKSSADSSIFQGFSNYNRSAQLTSNDTNYGLYFSYLQKNNITIASDYFFLSPPGATNSITTTDSSIVIGQIEPITYSIGAPDFIGSSYSINVYSLNTLVTAIPIASSNGTVNWDTSGNSNGLYFITISKTTSGIQTDIAYTTVTLVSTLLIKGKVYDAQNATTISGANINVSQGGSWFNTTSAADGNYNLSGLFITLVTNINASKTGYIHDNFSFTPLAAQVYTIDLYMINNSLNCSSGATTNTCIVGMTKNYPYHQAIPSATVALSNGSYSATTTSNATTGFYIFQNLMDDNLSYIVNATKTNYQNSTDYNVTTIKGTFKTQIIIMNAIYTLTIVAQDSTNANTILNFIATFNGTNYNVTTGTVSVSGIIYGQYSATVSSTGYLTSSKTILVDSTKTQVFILTPVVSGQATTLFKTLPHNVRFLVQDYTGNPYPGIIITAQGFNTTLGSFSWLSSLLGIDFGTTPINNVSMTGTTGQDGSASFMMIDTVYYQVNFNGGSNFNITWNIYPKEDFYILLIPLSQPNTGCANNITANLTQTTINSTYTTLGLTYSDPSSTTTLINFFVQDNKSNYLYTNSSSSSIFTDSFNVNTSIVGTTYFWGYNATVTGCNQLSQTQVVTFRGSGRFIDLHISDIYYQWISIFIIVFVAALFSIRKVKFGAVIVPITASIVWIFGWFTVNPIILAIAIVIGIMVYLRSSESKTVY